MKKVLLFAASLLLFASCQKAEVALPEQTATRAAEVTYPLEIVWMNYSTEHTSLNLYVIDQQNEEVYNLYEFLNFSWLNIYGSYDQVNFTSNYDDYRNQYGTLFNSPIVYHPGGGAYMVSDYYLPEIQLAAGTYRVIFEYGGDWYFEEIEVGANHGGTFIQVDFMAYGSWYPFTADDRVHGRVHGYSDCYFN